MRVAARSWLWGALTFAVVGAGIAATVRLADRAASTRDDGLIPGMAAFVETPAGSHGPLQRVDGRWIVPYAHELDVHYGVGLRNPLRHPLTLKGLEFEPDPNVLASHGYMAMFKLPFPPPVMVKDQTIAPGESRLVEIRFTLDVCSRFPPVSRIDIRRHVLAYEADGKTGRFDFWLREPISILPPPKGQCPVAVS